MLTREELKVHIYNLQKLPKTNKDCYRTEFVDVNKKGGLRWNDKARKNSYCGIIYLDNADIERGLKEFPHSIILSPLHDKDILDDTVKPPLMKKAHYHFMTWTKGKYYIYDIYEDIINSFGDCLPNHKPIDKTANTSSCVRYMLHLDHPEKAQYKYQDIRVGGMCPMKKAPIDFIESEVNTTEMCNKINDIQFEYGFILYEDFINYCKNNDNELLIAIYNDSKVSKHCKDMIRSHEYKCRLDGKLIEVYNNTRADKTIG